MSRCFLLALMTAAAPAQIEAVAEPRVLYTHHNGGCYYITDRAECCQHKDGRNYSEAGHYYHERCVPSAVGKTFTSGRVCEPECWVQGLCGDGSPQGDRIGQCLDMDFDDSILVVSEDTSSKTTTLWPVITTVAEIQPTGALSNRDKVIAGAVAGSVGGVALLGGLLGGLLTSTTPPLGATSPTLSPTRFLEGHSSGAHSTDGYTSLKAVLLFGAVVVGAVLAFGVMMQGRRPGARNVPGSTELADSTDDESLSSLSPASRSPVDTFNSAFDLIDTNHDGVISQDEFTAAFGVKRTIYSTAPPVYMSPKRLP